MAHFGLFHVLSRTSATELVHITSSTVLLTSAARNIADSQPRGKRSRGNTAEHLAADFVVLTCASQVSAGGFAKANFMMLLKSPAILETKDAPASSFSWTTGSCGNVANERLSQIFRTGDG